MAACPSISPMRSESTGNERLFVFTSKKHQFVFLFRWFFSLRLRLLLHCRFCFSLMKIVFRLCRNDGLFDSNKSLFCSFPMIFDWLFVLFQILKITIFGRQNHNRLIFLLSFFINGEDNSRNFDKTNSRWSTFNRSKCERTRTVLLVSSIYFTVCDAIKSQRSNCLTDYLRELYGICADCVSVVIVCK